MITALQRLEAWLKSKGYEPIVLAEYMVATDRTKRRSFTTFTNEPYTYLRVGIDEMTFRFDSKGRLKGLE